MTGTHIAAPADHAPEMRARDDYHEDDGPVLWWHLNEWGDVDEPPNVGTLNEINWWTDENYYAGWSPLPHPPPVPTALCHAPEYHRQLICDGWEFERG